MRFARRAVVLLPFVILAACGGSSNDASPADAGASGPDASADGAADADAASDASTSDAAETTCTSTTVLAITTLAFGEGNNGEWKKLGFDVDGMTWTPGATGVCKPNSGANPAVAFPDGDNGIDNSFGKNLLPILLSIDPTLATDANSGLQNGLFTAMLEMECPPPTGDAPVMTTKLFGGTALGSTPKFDGTDVWPVDPSLLSDPANPDSSTIVYDHASVLGSTFDTGKNQTFVLTIALSAGGQSTSLRLQMYAAHVTATLSADRKSATGGVIGGVLNTEELVGEIKKLGAALNVCSQSFFPNLVTAVRQASDIMADGTQDPSKTCDGISIGLGFELKQVQRGVVGPAPQVGMTCP